jgi:hypothetical protein
MRTTQAELPTLNAVFCTLVSNPAAAHPWKTAVVIRVLEDLLAALN